MQEMRIMAITITIVDDHDDTREMLEILMKDQYSVHSYSNAQHAFAGMKKQKPDLVITDMVLQDGLGTELVRWMRADPILRNTPAVVLTGLPFDKGFAEAGFQSFIQKPVDDKHLMHVIQQNLFSPKLP
jgi:twitching motility two-component system response regulator PilH